MILCGAMTALGTHPASVVCVWASRDCTLPFQMEPSAAGPGDKLPGVVSLPSSSAQETEREPVMAVPPAASGPSRLSPGQQDSLPAHPPPSEDFMAASTSQDSSLGHTTLLPPPSLPLSVPSSNGVGSDISVASPAQSIGSEEEQLEMEAEEKVMAAAGKPKDR